MGDKIYPHFCINGARDMKMNSIFLATKYKKKCQDECDREGEGSYGAVEPIKLHNCKDG